MRSIVDAIGDLPLPAAVLDLDAVDRNAKTLVDAMGSSTKTLRVASKSVRVPWVLRHLLATPFRITGGEAPAIGSIVLCRPAKAGEWLERFDEVAIVKGGRVIARERTYRGLGGAFG